MEAFGDRALDCDVVRLARVEDGIQHKYFLIRTLAYSTAISGH